MQVQQKLDDQSKDAAFNFDYWFQMLKVRVRLHVPKMRAHALKM